MIQFIEDDGGRAAAGYRGVTGDCVTRAIAIALERPYQEVYDGLNVLAQREVPRGRKKRSHARTGVHRVTYERYLKAAGWVWVPTMHVGSGCTVHLTMGEVPGGRLVVRLSRHVTAVVHGIVYDTYDPSREGTRCVYGYWHAG